ncbi:MAG: metal-dependent hydrolase, partial [Pirellulales bacterium]|nr:metal-dependent hydrolase [Pirellulales bacterium]
MADFKTHISTSGLLGVGYGAAAFVWFDVPWPTCVLAGGLCGVSGMLPDLDSDSGVPRRESVAFAAA